MRGRRFTPEALKVIEALGAAPGGLDLRELSAATGLPRRACANVLKRLVHLGHANSVKAASRKGWRRHIYTVNVVPRLRERTSGRLAPPKVVVERGEGLELLNKAFGVGRPSLPVRAVTVRRFIDEDEPAERAA